MRCPNCGTENADDARFCTRCGTTLAEDRPGVTPPAPAGEGPAAPGDGAGGAPRRTTELRRILSGGWKTAVLWSFVPLTAAFVLGLILSLLGSGTQPLQFAPPPPELERLFEPTFVRTLSGALIVAFSYHNATLTMDFPGIRAEDFPFPGGLEISASGTFTPMLGTALVALLLALGGRAVARSAGAGPGSASLLHGAKVAVPYTVLAVLVSLAARQSIALPDVAGAPFTSGEFTFGISPLSVLLWAALLALVFGALGGAWGDRDAVFAGTWGLRARAVLAGAWRMTWVALALSFVGLLVLAAVHAEGTRAYFEIVSDLGAAGGTSFVLNTLLFLPNMATWVASGAAGGTVLSAKLFGSSCSLISYTGFPAGTRDLGGLGEAGPEQFFADPCSVLPIRFETAPAGYFLFLLVPLVAVLLGGMAAARTRGPASAGERAAVGAGAGVAFALMMVILVLLSDFVFDISAPFVELFTRGEGFGIGPSALRALGVALVWGLLGGVGGALLARGTRGRASAGDAATSPSTGGPPVSEP